MKACKNIYLLFCLLYSVFAVETVYGGRYNVKTIDPALIENAVAVIREHHTDINVVNQNRSRAHYKTAITIINLQGLGYADLHLYLTYLIHNINVFS